MTSPCRNDARGFVAADDALKGSGRRFSRARDGDPDTGRLASLLVDAINYGDVYQMPPKSKLPEAEIAILTRWVEMRLPWGEQVVDPATSPVSLLAGPHFVSVNRAGYEGVSESVDVAAGERTTIFDVDLSRVSAVLRVVTRPAGAMVHIDTVPHGPTTGPAELDGSPDRVAVPKGQACCLAGRGGDEQASAR